MTEEPDFATNNASARTILSSLGRLIGPSRAT
jgi:hypothetical protein